MFGDQQLSDETTSFAVDVEKLKNFNQTDADAELINAKDVAEYASELLQELRDLAGKAELTFLAYLIQVAVEEARIQADEHRDR